MILNEDGFPFEKSNNKLISTEYISWELKRQLEAGLQWHRMLKLTELRRSCGVSTEIEFKVNIPERYKL